MKVSLQTLLDRSIKNIGDSHAVVTAAALELIKLAYREGIYVQISEGYRSNDSQTDLYNQGRTTSGNIITNAKAGQSKHNYGLAVDYFLVSDDGEDAIWDVNSKWKRAAAIAKSLGFAWGGDWTSFRDYPHLEMTGGLSLSQLQAGKKPNLKSKSSNTPDSNKKANLKVDGVPGKNTIKSLQLELGTTADSYISDQVHNQATDAFVSGIKFGAGKKGSLVVKALQELIGAKQDGLLGPNTVGKLQKYLGTTYDKVISDPSAMIKELQRRLNKGKL
ncbi:M15 family metallopeptidase [Paraliobacillus sediminis]|uniref:M15 family metallopeptidase n=1 Tax=Paraliobacillus sediminis TaxID=1885916 RepID=UPI000E3D7D9D|nr:M15 family metallopeptidase [Paraliobacillus sediminis]